MTTVNVTDSISDITNVYNSLNLSGKQQLFQKLYEESKKWTGGEIGDLAAKIHNAKTEKKEEILLASPEEMKALIKECVHLDQEWKDHITALIDKKEPYITKEREAEEEMLIENQNRFVILPLRFLDLWIMYKLHEASFWTAEEIDFSNDQKDWESLTEDERYFIKKVLAFFAASDGIIGENIVQRFYQDVQIPEAKCFVAGTPICLANGISIPIENVQIGEKILGFDESSGRIVDAVVENAKHHEEMKECVEILLEDGRSLRCTKDHRFLTDNNKQWVEANNLIANTSKVVMSVDSPNTTIAADDMMADWSIDLGKFGHLHPTEDLHRVMAFARLSGYFMATIIRTEPLCEKILADIELVCGKNIDTTSFHELIRSGYALPKFITKPGCPKLIVREFLAGCYARNGIAPKLSTNQISLISLISFTKSGYCMSSDEEQFDSLMSVVVQLQHLLKTFEVTTFSRVEHLNDNLFSIFIEWPENEIVKFNDLIGCRYHTDKMISVSVCASLFRMSETSPSFSINDWLQENDAFAYFTAGGSTTIETKAVVGTFKLKVKSVTEIGLHRVYDLTVNNPVNSFIANGAIVHNCFYAFQLAMEHTHSFTYSVMIDTYVKNEEERIRLFAAIHNDPTVRLKAQWALKWIHDHCASFAERLFAIACVEGIFFSGSFCSIFWLKKRGKMPGLTFSNELISRDEGLHMDFAIMLYSMLKYKLTQKQVEGIVRWAVAIEHMFVTEALPVKLLGMNDTLMRQYICFVADRLITCAGYERVWNVENPFEFMELISLSGKTNFFEKRVGEYQRSSVIAKTVEIIKVLVAKYGQQDKVSNFVKSFLERNSNPSSNSVEKTESSNSHFDPNAFTLNADF